MKNLWRESLWFKYPENGPAVVCMPGLLYLYNLKKFKCGIECSITVFFIFCPTWEFFPHMEMSPLPVKGCIFWPLLSTDGHWAVRFFSMPHLLWHRASVYNGHHSHTYCRAFGSRAVITCFYDLGLSNSQPSVCEANTLTNCATAAAV